MPAFELLPNMSGVRCFSSTSLLQLAAIERAGPRKGHVLGDGEGVVGAGYVHNLPIPASQLDRLRAVDESLGHAGATRPVHIANGGLYVLKNIAWRCSGGLQGPARHDIKGWGIGGDFSELL